MVIVGSLTLVSLITVLLPGFASVAFVLSFSVNPVLGSPGAPPVQRCINAQIIALNQQLANLLAELNALLLQTIPSSLSNGLLAYYSFTGNANDNSGNGNNGIVNGATLTSDRFGNLNNAYRFGTNKNILIPNPSSTLNLTSSFSISTWLTLDSLATIYNSSIIISKHDGDTGTDGWDYGIWNDHSYTSQFLNFWGSGISGYPSTNAIANVNNWYNFITTYDSTSKNISYYISGQLIASKTITLNIIPNTRPITIGYQTSSNGTYYGYFRGSIDDIKIYNRVLTNPEIQYLYFH